MSSSAPPRGRKVQRKAANQSTRLIYWSIGGVALIVVAFIAAFAIAGGFNQGTTTANVTSPSSLNIPTGTTAEGFYYKGSPDAPIKVMEYGDFQCPACAAYERTIGKQVLSKYVQTGQVQFIFHDFPLSQHPNAPKAAEAARCAGDQGKFWEMHETLYVKQNEWASLGSPINRFVAYAGQIGLNSGDFQSCLTNGTHTAKVASALQAANTAQIPATPTFVIDGKQYNASQLVAAIDALLANR